MAGVIGTFIQDHDKLSPTWNYISKRLDDWQLSAHDGAAKEWKKQLQTNVDGFPFSRQALAHIDPLLRLSDNSDPKIRCVARLRLSTAYFVANQLEKAGALLVSAETACEQQTEMMEELYYLRGRANSEMASKEYPPEVRAVFEDLALKNYRKSLQYAKQNDYVVITVVQICDLSLRRGNVSAADLKELEVRIREAKANRLAKGTGLMDDLNQQEAKIQSKIQSLNAAQEKEAEQNRLAAYASARQQQVDPVQATKNLKDVFATSVIVNPANSGKAGRTGKSGRGRKNIHRQRN